MYWWVEFRWTNRADAWEESPKYDTEVEAKLEAEILERKGAEVIVHKCDPFEYN